MKTTPAVNSAKVFSIELHSGLFLNTSFEYSRTSKRTKRKSIVGSSSTSSISSILCSSMGFDYYAILDIPRDASDVDIRLAYRKLAVRCHPGNDFHYPPALPFPTMSREQYWELLNEAFDVLSNSLRKRIYDIYGEEGLKSGVVTPHGFQEAYVFSNDCMKIYKDFFATYSPYGDLIDAVTKPPPLCLDDRTTVKVKGPDMEEFVDLELEEIFHGTTKKMQILREEFVDETQVETVLVEETVRVPIQPGVTSGTKIRFEEAGDRNPKIIPSDIVFVVREKDHPLFSRDKADLHMIMPITLKQSLVGFPLKIVGIDGRQLMTEVVDVVHPEYTKIFKGEGLPKVDSTKVPKPRGDLCVSFKIDYPDFIPKRIREQLKEIFDDLYSIEKPCV
ncbi:dnaJ homolog subfamily B member 13-like [Malaya genurostris]|uniref:dnaJ homolog subfamily B member 13-like n=1 Tax=Malaya genurostris TaxID=325434 RepID=UPI0026F3D071|nr:dnaJ homolog subfamily B member 13-like [Malaya genurostris]